MKEIIYERYNNMKKMEELSSELKKQIFLYKNDKKPDVLKIINDIFFEYNAFRWKMGKFWTYGQLRFHISYDDDIIEALDILEDVREKY